MAKLTIEDLPPWNGVYEFDESSFTNRELHTIKQISGVRAGELGEAMQAGDNDVLIAIAAIALKRNRMDVPLDDLWDAEMGKLLFDFRDEDEEAGGAAVPPAPTQPDTPSGDVLLPNPSGPDSRGTGDRQASHLSPTGMPGSDITPTSDPETLAS